jgi:hypothetical protein
LKIVYYCYGSAHSSVIAAAIHLKKLPWDRIPTLAEVEIQERFDRTENWEIGTPFFMGTDREGNEVYTLGLGPDRIMIRRIIASLIKIWNYPAREILLVDTLVCIHCLTRIGGFLSRKLGLVTIGRPLAALGIRLSYNRLLELVQATIAQVQRADYTKNDTLDPIQKI